MMPTPPPLRHHGGAYTTPCSSLAADGVFRGLMVGIAWSAAFGPHMNLWALHGAHNASSGTNKMASATSAINERAVISDNDWRRRRRHPAPPLPTSKFNVNDGSATLRSLLRRSWCRANTMMPVTISLVRNCSAFAVFLGVFNGAQCTCERVRGGRRDWKNAFAAGFTSAAIFGLRNPHPMKMVATSILTGAFCAAVGQARGVNKKPS